MLSQVQETDELLTRYSITGSRKVVVRKHVRTAIKLAVSEAGPPPQNFSTKVIQIWFRYAHYSKWNRNSGNEIEKWMGHELQRPGEPICEVYAQ